MNAHTAIEQVPQREPGGRGPVTTADFAPITGEPFPLITAVSS